MIALLLRLAVLSPVLGCRREAPDVLICGEDDVEDIHYLDLDSISEIR